ncbi:Ig-like domain-containing protein [Myceligenerans halotolerans]
MSRLVENKRAVASASVVTIFSGALLGLALWYDGEATADVVLNDSGIWVTRAGHGELGRYNFEAGAIDGILPTNSTSFDVSQSAGRVLLDDVGQGEAGPVDPAHVQLGGTLAMPSGAQVASGGPAFAVYDPADGRLWVLPFDGMLAFDEDELEPTAQVGSGGVLTVGTVGTVYVASPAGGTLTSVATGAQGAPGEVTEESLTVEDGADIQVTAVGDRPVVLDRSGESVILPDGKRVRLDGLAEAMLQQPSAEVETVAIAGTGFLVNQPLDGGDALKQPASGRPAAPVQLGGCNYGAWSSSGEVIRDCPGVDDDSRQTLEGLPPNAILQFRTNRGRIILNDVIGGGLWLPTEDYRKVDDWELTVNESDEGEETDSEETVQELVDQFVAPRDQPNNPPEPKDDDIGVRPGRTTVLNVLGNDVDPDGDVMTVTLEGDPEVGREITVHEVLDGKALQADVPAGATGTVSFEYTVDDGREGGTATANVELTVHPMEENEPPEQTGEPVLKVAQAGTESVSVLPYFKDPEGDDLFLSNATTTDPTDEVRARPDGSLEFLDGGGATGRKIVEVQVADGEGGAAQGRVLVDVVAEDEPPIPVQDHVTTLVGEPVTAWPLRNDSDPNGDKLRLVNVAGPEGVEITPGYTAGNFAFFSEKAGSYDVTYQVSDDSSSSVGLVRVDVLEPPDEAGKPVVVSDRVLLPQGGEGLVDVLANDSDPSGGVLVVQSIDVPEDSGLTVAVLDHSVLRITERQRLGATVTLGYTASNGSSTAEGQVQVVPIPTSSRLRPPEAGADEVDVHVGDTVTIPVLKNDSHPDGLSVELESELVEEPDAAKGEAFVSEEVVRFKAGDEAGVAHAVYEVTDPNGQRDSAQITININGDEENTAPQLPEVTARVLSGGTVRVDVPLDGTDPDGDYVMLSDISGAPAKGQARIVDGFIDYQASPDAIGTDTFTYQVTDSRGAVGVGHVRVGIAPLPMTNQSPVAEDDTTLVRPGRTVAIDALANDSDPDGDQIGLVESLFGSAEDLDPRVVDDEVVVTAPEQNGEHPFFYGIQDTYKARAQGAITVQVDDDAPLEPPVAHDDVLSRPDVVGNESVTVDLLANDVDPDGVAADLVVTLDSPADGLTLSEDGKLSIDVQPDLQIITYTVTDMDGLTSSAFVRVPGDELTPHLKPGLDPIVVYSGEPEELDIAEYVVVEDGREPRITEESTVSGVEGAVEVIDLTGITYTAKEDYTGPASVSFEVTDGDGPDDPDGRKATLTLPLEVKATNNQPPEFRGAPKLEVPAGDEGAVDLAAYVDDPENDPLTFDVKSGGDGLALSVEGSTVTARADASVAKGSSSTIDISVTDGKTDPVRGELTVAVVASTRPLPATGEDRVDDAHQGVATSVAVLVNDTNPFPDTPLDLVGVPRIEAGDGAVDYSGDQVVVTPDENFQGLMRVRYTVQDATDDPDRQVDGIIKLTVLGKPEAPRAPRVEEVRSETVVLTWDEPNNNGAPITGYTVTSSEGDERACPTTTCTVGGLTNDVTYTFTVQAENEVGLSQASPPSQQARPDQKPDQPAPPKLEFGDESLTVTWTNEKYSDRSPIQCVNLEISPAPPSGPIHKSCLPGTSTVWEGLRNGTSYTVRVQARNDAPDPSEWSDPSAPEVPAGPPARPAAPTATRVNTVLGGQVNVKWTAPANNGDAIKRYHLDVLESGSTVRTIEVSGTSQTVEGLDTKKDYTFRVTAENKAGKGETSPQSGAVTPYGTPPRPARPEASLGSNTSGQANVRWTDVGDARGTGKYYQVRRNGSGAVSVGNTTSYTYKGLNNGTSYTFQVRACNEYVCSAWSEPSNAVTPYTTPGTPRISWTKSASTGGYFTVRGPSSNGGRAVQKIEWSISGSRNDSGTKTSWPFDISVTGGYGKSWTVKARACNAAGCGAYATKKADIADLKVWVTASSNGPDCSEVCKYWAVHWQNLEGSHKVACWAGDTSNNGGPRAWHDIHPPHPTTWAAVPSSNKYDISGASGTKQLPCYMGRSYNGTQVAMYVDGVRYTVSTWNV